MTEAMRARPVSHLLRSSGPYTTIRPRLCRRRIQASVACSEAGAITRLSVITHASQHAITDRPHARRIWSPLPELVADVNRAGAHVRMCLAVDDDGGQGRDRSV
jgi:hypothetical protein